MKIYPSKFNLISKENVQYRDIPLAKIDTEHENRTVNIKEENSFRSSTTSERFLEPYDDFTHSNPYVVDGNGNKVDISSSLIREGQKYIYIPSGAVEFTPKRIGFKALAKKNMDFSYDNQYNIRIIASGKDIEFAKELHSIFGDAPRRNLSPANVSVNGQDLSYESLISGDKERSDWLFIESDDIFTTNGEDINIDEILESRINLWITAENMDFFTSNGSKDYKVRSPLVYNGIKMKSEGTFVNNSKIPEGMEEYEKIEFFESAAEIPLIVFKKEGYGFIVISHRDMIKNSIVNHKLIYETLFFPILKGWFLSERKDIWISDNPVNRLALKRSSFNRRHPKITEQELIRTSRYDINNYSMKKIIFENGIDFPYSFENSEVFIQKTEEERTDPVRQEDQISVYTTRHTIMFYHQLIKEVELGLNAVKRIKDTGIYIVLKPGISTTRRLYLESEIEFKLPDLKNNYKITGRDRSFRLIRETEETTEIIMHRIEPITEEITKKYDLRIKGGGLPLNMKNDYALTDIGHLYGRPHRVGSSAVIRLPKRLEPYEKIIRQEVERHQVGTEALVIIFE